ncbi:hypothetical protein V494_01642 [Pseudogymnoascus sp. VKM F-4513 (FW-928)]|nr:hypothetical protein V494_01642 [Pseudogymnoascus sp. VKM F-4513 (FW-928)]
MGSNMGSTINAIEEETLPNYKPEQFYPVHIGEIIKTPQGKYKVIGKLGYGRYSTVWLCLELIDNTFYTIKIGTTHNDGNREAATYKHLQPVALLHPGRRYVRKLHEAFELSGPNGQHSCLVHPPLEMNLDEFQQTFPNYQYPPILLKALLHCLFSALDFLHLGAGVIHTDIQAQNILVGLTAPSPVLNFVSAEQENPSACKVINGTRSIYVSRSLPHSHLPGNPTLCDFGHAVRGPPETKHSGVIQPLPYRAPEVILGIPWGAEADIWNLGVLVRPIVVQLPGAANTMTDMAAHVRVPTFHGTTEAEQLAAMVACLGLPPAEFVQRCREEGKGARYFDEDGTWSGETITPAPIDDILEGSGVAEFLDLLKSMLTWVPEERLTAAELKQHEWLQSR